MLTPSLLAKLCAGCGPKILSYVYCDVRYPCCDVAFDGVARSAYFLFDDSHEEQYISAMCCCLFDNLDDGIFR